jgi:sigma-B regulation protein RsbU (phosphoserine phosphatase)
VRFFLADVTGHGVPAALFAMLLKSEYENVKFLPDPVSLLEVINNVFFSTYGSLHSYFTCVVMDVDTAEMKLRFVTAGHPNQYLLRSGNCIPLHSKGRIIGVLPNPEFLAEEIALEGGDRLILFTDGVIEQTNPEGEEYGEARLIDSLLAANEKNSCAELNAAILAAIKDFKRDQNPDDDITLISIRCPKKGRRAKKSISGKSILPIRLSPEHKS